jgi:hypothetical protein
MTFIKVVAQFCFVIGIPLRNGTATFPTDGFCWKQILLFLDWNNSKLSSADDFLVNSFCVSYLSIVVVHTMSSSTRRPAVGIP